MAGCPGIINSVLWFLILWFIAWPIAAFLSFWYILFLPFTVFFPALKDICDTLLRWIQMVVVCGENMKSQKSLC